MRWLRRILVALLLIVLVAGAFGFWTVRRSFPNVNGEIELAGLNDTVEVIRDDWGVAHIYARNAQDLFFAQGYTHAQERFWQMDFWRHIGSARLTEMFGIGQLETDRFLRSLGLVELAERELELMDPEVREILEWYADGVNAYLADHDGAEVSLEYAILPLQASGYSIEPWTPIHTLTWAKMMSWDLSGNMRAEITRAVLSAQLPVERVEQLYPPYPEEHPVIVPGDQITTKAWNAPDYPDTVIEALTTVIEGASGVWDLTGGGFEGIGSNNWAIDGSMTESGKPLLANDPHLGIQMPSIWFANGLHCIDGCDLRVVGFSFPGAPGVVIGHNAHLAWGVTTEAIDTQDLYIERVNPDNPNQYEADGEWVDFDSRTEVFELPDGTTEEFIVRATRHGPVVSGTFLEENDLDGSTAIDLPEDYVVALAWQSLQPSTLIEAILGINRAGNYDEFRSATSLWDVAGQNIVYADIDGNIAYQSTGEIPVRSKGDGRYPVPGWASEYEWTGIVDFEAMPSLLNPPRGYVASANQPIVAPGTSPLATTVMDSAYGYRADRIESLLASTTSHGVSSTHQLQMDARDGGAAHIVPFLLDVSSEGDPVVEEVQQSLREMQQDDYQATGDSPAGAVYQATWRHLLVNLFHDDLPEEYHPRRRAGNSRWFEVVRHLLAQPADPWWDEATTAEIETRDDILATAMVDAHAELIALLGEDIGDWTWGKLHVAHFENQTLGQSGIGPIEWLFNRTAPERVGGGGGIVNATGWDYDTGYELTWLPSMRMVVDLSDLSKSTFIHTTGNSGHAFNGYYDNMIEAWTDGVQAPMYWTKQDVEAVASSTLTLIPKG